jgi:hypothetical protein
MAGVRPGITEGSYTATIYTLIRDHKYDDALRILQVIDILLPSRHFLSVRALVTLLPLVPLDKVP